MNCLLKTACGAERWVQMISRRMEIQVPLMSQRACEASMHWPLEIEPIQIRVFRFERLLSANSALYREELRDA